MSRNGSGTYSLPAGNPVVTGTTISSTWANNTLSDIASALTASIAKDGQTVATANLPMGGYKHTNVAVAASTTDYARADQVTNSSLNYLTSVSGTDTITANALITPGAYAAGQTFWFISAGANTGAVTLNVSGLGAKDVKKNGNTALAASDIPSGAIVTVVYDGTNFQLIGLAANTAVSATSAATVTTTVASGATGTTQSAGDNSTKIATTAYADAAVAGVMLNPTVPQTVLSGPVDSSGYSAFGGSTGSTTVTASGTLKATAAAGSGVNYTGSITNPSWTGLSTNGTMYLYLSITSAGVVTTGSTALKPAYQWGGTYSTTNNQHTFNIQEMTMKVGDGAAANQVYRVFVGQVTVAGGVTTAITWYALMGQYKSADVACTATATTTTFTHNVGYPDCKTDFYLRCGTAQANITVGEVVSNLATQNGAAYVPLEARQQTDWLTAKVTTAASAAYVAVDATSGATTTLTAANFNQFIFVTRGW